MCGIRYRMVRYLSRIEIKYSNNDSRLSIIVNTMLNFNTIDIILQDSTNVNFK